MTLFVGFLGKRSHEQYKYILKNVDLFILRLNKKVIVIFIKKSENHLRLSIHKYMEKSNTSTVHN